MNPWNTVPESYQQRVYENSLPTVQRQIQQAENQTHAVDISVEVACVDNDILLDYLTSEVALEERGIGSTDPTIPIDLNARMTNCISGCQGSVGITKMTVTKAMRVMPSPPPAGEDGQQLNSRGLTREPVMSMGMRVRMATMLMLMRMRRKQHRKPIMDKRRMGRTEGIVGNVDGYECEHGDNADADEDEDPSPADDGS